MARSVVYTCLFGHYDSLPEQPVARNSEIDFICFTDQTDLESETWQVRTVPTLGLGSARESRRPKLVPHLFLREYDQSCYIDCTVRLKVAPEEIFTILEADHADFLCLRHPWRDCIYVEAECVIRDLIDEEPRVREQVNYYRNQGFPAAAGLIAGGFLLRRHNVKHVAEFGEAWFAHVLRYSKRDQLSFPFVAKQRSFEYKTLEFDLTSNPFFEWPVLSNRLPYGFQPDIYLWLNADVAQAGIDPAEHYLKWGQAEGRPLRYHTPLELNRLANKHRSDKGDLYYNRHFYTRVYESYLRGLRDDQFTLLEIGLLRHDIQARSPDGPFHDAPSLRMWEEYFHNAQIHGLDIQNFTAAEGERITITRGDQSNRDDLASAVAKNKHPMKVVVDDGSHASHHQQIALGFLFRHLAPGGLYFIEDLGYQPPHLERANAPKTRDVLRRLQRDVDSPPGFASRAWRDVLSRTKGGAALETEFISPDDMAYLREHAASVEFYDSMDYQGGPASADALAVIHKR